MGGEEDEMHDFELERMLAEAREQRDSSKTSQAAPKPLIVEDDLRWLLDKEDNGGSMKAGAAKQAQEELDGVLFEAFLLSLNSASLPSGKKLLP